MLLRKTLEKYRGLCYNNPGRRFSDCIGVPRTLLCRSCHAPTWQAAYFFMIILYSENSILSTVLGIFIRRKIGGVRGYSAFIFSMQSRHIPSFSFKPFSLPHNLQVDRKSTRLNSSHANESRMPSSA